MATITVLVPAFKSTYLSELLVCLRAQTMRDFRVLVSDDSPDDRIIKFFEQPEVLSFCGDLDIRVVRGPKRGAGRNIMSLLRAYAGTTPFVHLLMDDDLIYPEFYAAHVAAHNQASCRVSVSRRWTASANGLPVATLSEPDRVRNQSRRHVIVERGFLVESVVAPCNNWLGEFSNMVFRADALDVLTTWEISGVSYIGLADVGCVVGACQSLSMCWIADTLGAFRRSPQQTTGNFGSASIKAGYLAWLALASASLRSGLMSSDQALLCYSHTRASVSKAYHNDASMLSWVEKGGSAADIARHLVDEFPPMWTAFLDSYSESLKLDI